MHELFSKRVQERLANTKQPARIVISSIVDLLEEEITRTKGISGLHFSSCINAVCSTPYTQISGVFYQQAPKQGFKLASVEELLRKTYGWSKTTRIDLAKKTPAGLRLSSAIAFKDDHVVEYVRRLYVPKEVVRVARVSEREAF